MNKSRETRSCSAGRKFPESTGDKLPAGEIDSTFLGKLLDWTLLGKFLRYTGEVAPLERLVYHRGTIWDQDYRGCLLRMFVYSAEECLIFAGGYPIFLKADRITLLGESELTC